jgi:hypothetical protein
MIFDALSFMGEHGIVITALILSLLVIFYIVWHYIRKRWIAAGVLLGKWDQILLLLEVEIENSSGNLDSLKHLIDKFREEFKIYEINHTALTRKHQEESALTASEEHWKNCPIERCPTMHKVIKMVEEYRLWLHNYTDETKATRELTRESINVLTNKLDYVAGELLTSVRDASKYKWDGKERRKA